ncbi:hypothetical protein M0804_001540 [Polistes exclamans]|nr:hypothetical protein M0804_001540 [Polistes exclamans]
MKGERITVLAQEEELLRAKGRGGGSGGGGGEGGSQQTLLEICITTPGSYILGIYFATWDIFGYFLQ